MTMHVLCFRGTGEPAGAPDRPTGLIADFVARLPADEFVCHQVGFPATIGPVGAGLQIDGVALDTSVRMAVTAAIELLRTLSGRAGLVGYSLGGLGVSALLVELLAAELRAALIPVVFALNFANPGRRAGESMGDLCGPVNFGLHGQRVPGPADIPVLEFANPRDMITSCDPDSPIRRISDGVSPFSLIEGGRIGDVSAQLGDLRRTEARWRFWDPLFWARYRQALADVAGYLPRPDGGPTEHSLYSSPAHHYPGTPYTWTGHAANVVIARWGSSGSSSERS